MRVFTRSGSSQPRSIPTKTSEDGEETEEEGREKAGRRQGEEGSAAGGWWRWSVWNSFFSDKVPMDLRRRRIKKKKGKKKKGKEKKDL